MTGNRSWSGTRVARAVVFAILTLGLSATALSLGVPKAAAQAQAQPQSPSGPTSDVRAVLSQYGNFVQHEVRRGLGSVGNASGLASLPALSLGLHQTSGLVFRR